MMTTPRRNIPRRSPAGEETRVGRDFQHVLSPLGLAHQAHVFEPLFCLAMVRRERKAGCGPRPEMAQRLVEEAGGVE